MTNPSIWTPGQAVSAESSNRVQTFIASAGQTYFIITNFTYETGTNSLEVSVSGVTQRPGIDYIETGSNSFSLTSPVEDVGTAVFVRGLVEVSGNPQVVSDASNVSYLTETVKTALDVRLPEIANYAVLRAYAGLVTAYYVRGVTDIFDGGAGVFRVDAADATTADNGGTVLVDASGRRWKREFSGDINVKWFGAVGDSVTDDTAAFTSAIQYAFSAGKTVLVDIPVYITNTEIAGGSGTIQCVGEGKILPHDTASQIDIYGDQLLKFGSEVVGATYHLVFDMRGFSKSACEINGAFSRIPYVSISNIQGASGRTSQLFGISVSGDNTEIGDVHGNNLNSVSTMSSGGATLSITQFAQNVRVNNIYSNAGFCAYLGNGVDAFIDNIYAENCTDNVVYSIAGSERFVCNQVIARNCSDEVVVFSGDDGGVTVGNSDGYVGKVVCYDCGRGVGFYKTTNPRIGVVEWHVSSMSANSGSPLFIRPTQTTQLDRITVEELRVFGTWSVGAPIWTLDHGGVKNLHIGKVFARLSYTDVALAVTTTLGFTAAPVEKVSIGEIDIAVADGTGGLLTSAQIFRLNLPTTISKLSTIDAVSLSSNGGSHQVRLINAIQNTLIIRGAPSVRTDLNPPFIYNADNGQFTRFCGSGASPTQGTWKRGDIVWNQFPSANGYVGWVCTIGGTPGTWKGFGVIQA